mgnify:FL=1
MYMYMLINDVSVRADILKQSMETSFKTGVLSSLIDMSMSSKLVLKTVKYLIFVHARNHI